MHNLLDIDAADWEAFLGCNGVVERDEAVDEMTISPVNTRKLESPPFRRTNLEASDADC
jgi:hypothetical protein